MFKMRFDPYPVVAKFSKGGFDHRFGGSPRHKGAVPKGKSLPMHLLLSLDPSDPLCPIELEGRGLKSLPLYYPLRYGPGGSEVQYSVDSDTQITILSPLHEEVTDEDIEDECTCPFPEKFPEYGISFKPLSYTEHRALVMADCGTNHHINDPEKKADHEILKRLDYWRMIRMGGDVGAVIEWTCFNKRCGQRGETISVKAFASLTNQLTDELSIWGEDEGDCAVVFFGVLPCCNTIVTENQCS